MQAVVLRIGAYLRDDGLWLPGKEIVPPTRGQRVSPKQTRDFGRVGQMAIDLAKWPSWPDAVRCMVDGSQGRLNPDPDLLFTERGAVGAPAVSVLGRSATDGQVLRRTAAGAVWGNLDLANCNETQVVEPKYESHLLIGNLTGFRLIDEDGVFGLSCLVEGCAMMRGTRYEVAMHVFVPFEEPIAVQVDDADRRFELAIGWADE